MANGTNNSTNVKSASQLENDRIKETAELTVKLLDQRYSSQNKKILRGVHPKSHGCVKAKFKINEDIPEALQIGLFSEPGKEYEARIRFSNASARVAADLDGFSHGSRGMAIKVLAVTGEEEILLDDDGARNQDFLMINTPAFAFANVEDYLRLTKVIHENDDDPAKFFAPLAVPGFPQDLVDRTKQSFAVVQEIKSKPVANPLGVQYFGAAPFLFGANKVMKFSVIPCGGEQPQLFPKDISENYLAKALISRMEKDNDVSFDFMVQIRDRNETGLDIEDATTSWNTDEFPFVAVARVTIPTPQPDIATEQNKSDCEKLVFTPWHTLASHKPLGSINRLRKNVYIASAKHRET